MTDPSPSDSSFASTSGPQCSICEKNAAIYTCPRCATRTCSLPCSNSHKSQTRCSGLRDKARYVPMNQYSLGTMMDDFVYLEEMGRKVGDWGKEIVRGGFGPGQSLGKSRDGVMGTRGGSQGRGRGRGRGGVQRTKRDVLKMQLELRDVDVDMLPAGMAKRMVNQSTWDFKNRTALLTIEFKFYPPQDPAANPSHPQDPPYTLLTHRNNFDLPLISLIQSQIKERLKGKRENPFPHWLKPLILPDQEVPDSFTPPQFLMPTALDPLTTPLSIKQFAKIGYHRLEATQKLSTLLRHKHFVEFPVIEIWEEGAFRGLVVDERGGMQREGDERVVKRRKLDIGASKKAMSGLLSGYGSDEEREEDTPITVLGDYAGSEDDGTLDDEDEGDALGAEELEGDSDEDKEIGPVDYAALLDILRQNGVHEAGGDDEVDWGEDEDEVRASARNA
ncbi:hypothetical protein HETIRDRAFT_314398 [Heterobasidion irregulare TC 32-1]|uniref:HIT-type domain-containing protein n=1 Tax=Heterobasidion irregulare (strain TC 32-1) TaxID=747525 RepID=W4KFN9_HETIT|nr:uncharacterized protein HETIRDRAFT_314398 [Heterobasidion irregulare TC 32-1]ETW83856.1 hypothetical protein HETIRDRAFT_314398 [Heterobasidion irregulare TC 32-1]